MKPGDWCPACGAGVLQAAGPVTVPLLTIPMRLLACSQCGVKTAVQAQEDRKP